MHLNSSFSFVLKFQSSPVNHSVLTVTGQFKLYTIQPFFFFIFPFLASHSICFTPEFHSPDKDKLPACSNYQCLSPGNFCCCRTSKPSFIDSPLRLSASTSFSLLFRFSLTFDFQRQWERVARCLKPLETCSLLNLATRSNLPLNDYHRLLQK